MEAMCSWNKTWQVGSNNQDCFKKYCDKPNWSLLHVYAKEDWCPEGLTVKKADETRKWDEKQKMDASQRLAAERDCRWGLGGEGISLDKIECYAINCALPNTSVNELFNYNFEWKETDPMTELETYITYPCIPDTKLMDPDLWWMDDAVNTVDVFCGLDGEYQYPEPWLTCFPGK